MTRLKLLALLPLAISAAAFAADSASTGSEYMHMASSGKWEVTPMIEYHDWTLKYNSPSSVLYDKAENTGMIYGVKGEYGINDMFSVSLNISGESDSLKQTPTGGGSNTNASVSGMNNIDLVGNGKYDMGGSTLRYGLDFSLSFAKSKYDVTGDGAYGSNTGGMDVTPFVGWEMAMGPGIFGVKFSYLFMLSDRKFSETGTTAINSEKGVSAQSLTAFYEWMNNNWSLGLALSYNGVTGSKIVDDAGNSTNSDSGHAGIFAQLYAPIMVADNITIIPAFGFGDNGEPLLGEASVKSWNGWDLSVAARFGF